MFELTQHPIDVLAVQDSVMTPKMAPSYYSWASRGTILRSSRHASFYEACSEMALAALRKIGQEAAIRWPGTKTAIVLRALYPRVKPPS